MYIFILKLFLTRYHVYAKSDLSKWVNLMRLIASVWLLEKSK